MEENKYINTKLYMIKKDKDGYYLEDGIGYIIESEYLEDIGKGLIKFAKKNTDSIIKHNERINYEIRSGIYFNCGEKIQKEKPKSKLYVMESNGRYKIGVSKDIKRRQKEIDCRPFKTNILFQTKFVAGAYEIEKELHEYFEDKRINGEWFNLNENDLKLLENWFYYMEQEEC